MGFLRKLEELFAAVAFAEAGEFEAARQMAAGPRRGVAVLMGTEADQRVLAHAQGIARRIGAGLELLLVGPEAQAKAQGLLQGLGPGERPRLSVLPKGCIKKAVLRHTREHKGIQLVVADSVKALNEHCQEEGRRLTGILRQLSCPLVLVSELQGP